MPLNMQTLYADLVQRAGQGDVRAGSISTKTVDGKTYLYAVEKHGKLRLQRFLGPAASADVQGQARQIRFAAEEAKQRRATVAALKNARVPAPSMVLGRILEVIANAGLFERGVTLVGTAAYQTYGCALGVYLPASALMTNDADISVAEFVAGGEAVDIESILKRADPTFRPVWGARDKLPKMFKSSNGFSVDVVTRFVRGRTSPVEIVSLGCAAEALSYQEYPAEETMSVVALYGSGVLVRVPVPLRYAIHKLIVAQQRKPAQAAKKRKDLMQAKELIDIFIATDEDALLDGLEEARGRGRAWKAAIDASLKELGRETRAGRLPVEVVAAK